MGGEGITLPIHRQGDFLCAGAELCGLRPPGQPVAREKCEEFAPRNGTARAREERGANRARTMPTGGPPTSKLPARGSRPKTENKGFAGSRARTMPAGGPPIPKFLARGSRPKTENKGFARSRARTMPAAGLPLLTGSPLPMPARRAHPTS